MIYREKFHFIFLVPTAILPNERLKEQSNETCPYEDVACLTLRRLPIGMVMDALPCAGWRGLATPYRGEVGDHFG
jgi:hypothetical protein